MYENVIIDETSVYEIDEQCRKCKQGDSGTDTGKRAERTGNYSDISRTVGIGQSIARDINKG